MSTCQCSMAISMLGDGCRYCQPQTYIEHLLETLEDARAAPVSEVRAQGVVMPEGWIPLTIEHEPGYPEDVAFGPKRMMDRLKKWLDRYFEMRLNAAPVQQVSVPDGWKLVPVELTREMAKAVGDLAERKWCYCLTAANVCEIFSTVLAAAPAAPAADAGDIVLNASAQEILSQCIGAHAYVLGVLANGRPDLAFTEAKKWVDAFKKAATQMEPSHD